MARDPVCGMTVDKKNPPERLVYRDKEYVFCCTSCKETFEKNPAQYLASTDSPSEHTSRVYYSRSG